VLRTRSIAAPRSEIGQMERESVMGDSGVAQIVGAFCTVAGWSLRGPGCVRMGVHEPLLGSRVERLAVF
jgi:hypothetical protein